MFDSVLGRATATQGRLGTGTALSIVAHVAIAGAILWQATRPRTEKPKDVEVTFSPRRRRLRRRRHRRLRAAARSARRRWSASSSRSPSRRLTPSTTCRRSPRPRRLSQSQSRRRSKTIRRSSRAASRGESRAAFRGAPSAARSAGRWAVSWAARSAASWAARRRRRTWCWRSAPGMTRPKRSRGAIRSTRARRSPRGSRASRLSSASSSVDGALDQLPDRQAAAPHGPGDPRRAGDAPLHPGDVPGASGLGGLHVHHPAQASLTSRRAGVLLNRWST